MSVHIFNKIWAWKFPKWVFLVTSQRKTLVLPLQPIIPCQLVWMNSLQNIPLISNKTDWLLCSIIGRANWRPIRLHLIFIIPYASSSPLLSADGFSSISQRGYRPTGRKFFSILPPCKPTNLFATLSTFAFFWSSQWWSSISSSKVIFSTWTLKSMAFRVWSMDQQLQEHQRPY